MHGHVLNEPLPNLLRSTVLSSYTFYQAFGGDRSIFSIINFDFHLVTKLKSFQTILKIYTQKIDGKNLRTCRKLSVFLSFNFDFVTTVFPSNWCIKIVLLTRIGMEFFDGPFLVWGKLTPNCNRLLSLQLY